MPDRDGVDALYRQLSEKGAALRGAPAAYDGPHRRLRLRGGRPGQTGACASTADIALRDADDVHAYPRKISHVVLNTPDMDGVQQWYEEMLGFRTSDYSADQMVFLRIGSDHHAIALVRAQYASVNHVAFEMPGIDSFMRGIGRMKQQGQVPSWGPGRHGPGNNPFAYFVSPSGFVIEFTSEVQQIDEATHEPKVWSRTDPEAMDQWMTAGPPTPAQRAVHGPGGPIPAFRRKAEGWTSG